MVDGFTIAHRLSRKQARLLDRMRDPLAAETAAHPGTTNTFEALSWRRVRAGGHVSTLGPADPHSDVVRPAPRTRIRREPRRCRQGDASATRSARTRVSVHDPRQAPRSRHGRLRSHPRSRRRGARGVGTRSSLRRSPTAVRAIRNPTRRALGLHRANAHRTHPRARSAHAVEPQQSPVCPRGGPYACPPIAPRAGPRSLMSGAGAQRRRVGWESRLCLMRGSNGSVVVGWALSRAPSLSVTASHGTDRRCKRCLRPLDTPRPRGRRTTGSRAVGAHRCSEPRLGNSSTQSLSHVSYHTAGSALAGASRLRRVSQLGQR